MYFDNPIQLVQYIAQIHKRRSIMEDLYKECGEVKKWDSYICIIVDFVRYNFTIITGRNGYEFISPLTGEILDDVNKLEKHILEMLENYPDLKK